MAVDDYISFKASESCKAIEGISRGKQYPIAVKAYFPTNGMVNPEMFKIKDSNGNILIFNEFHVMYTESRIYSGIPSYEFIIRLTVDRRKYNAKMTYYPERNVWGIMFQ